MGSNNVGVDLKLRILVIVMTVFCMALTDAVFKTISLKIGIWQIYTLRSLICLSFLLTFIYSINKSKGIFTHCVNTYVVIRSIIMILMYIFLYLGVVTVDLPLVAVCLYTSPLFVIILSSIFMDEHIKMYSLIAVFLGFFGVFIASNPFGSTVNVEMIFPIVAAFLYASVAVLTSAKMSHVPPVALATTLNFFLLLLGITLTIALKYYGNAFGNDSYFFFTTGWVSTTHKMWWVILALSVLFILIAVGFSFAYQTKSVSTIAFFDYSYIIFASAIGYFYFHESITLQHMVGILLVVLSGAVVSYGINRTSSYTD